MKRKLMSNNGILGCMVACTAFVLALGTRSVSADEGIQKVETENGVFYYSVFQPEGEHETDDVYEISMVIKGEALDSMESFVTTTYINENGEVITANPEDLNVIMTGNMFAIQSQDGEMLFSFNGAEEIPGINISVSEANSENMTTFLVKIENGITYYSADGGVSWSNELPEGIQTVNIETIEAETE